MKRCDWCGEDELYQHYHDTVWGRPEYDSQELFKKLCLDGQQAGLSWITILKKQANYEAAFFDFDPVKMSVMNDADVNIQMNNAGIVRNKLKIKSLIKNANAYLKIENEIGPFSKFIWSFVGHKPQNNCWSTMAEIPTETVESQAMSKELKKRGFSFVGPTICYAFMQAVGMVNDHITSCHCYDECKDLCESFTSDL